MHTFKVSFVALFLYGYLFLHTILFLTTIVRTCIMLLELRSQVTLFIAFLWGVKLIDKSNSVFFTNTIEYGIQMRPQIAEAVKRFQR